jgi:hypothetical protein
MTISQIIIELSNKIKTIVKITLIEHTTWFVVNYTSFSQPVCLCRTLAGKQNFTGTLNITLGAPKVKIGSLLFFITFLLK